MKRYFIGFRYNGEILSTEVKAKNLNDAKRKFHEVMKDYEITNIYEL